MQRMSSKSNSNRMNRNSSSLIEEANGVAPKKGMILPFSPLAMSFDTVNYYVDMPPVRKNLFSSSFVHDLALNFVHS